MQIKGLHKNTYTLSTSALENIDTDSTELPKVPTKDQVKQIAEKFEKMDLKYLCILI